MEEATTQRCIGCKQYNMKITKNNREKMYKLNTTQEELFTHVLMHAVQVKNAWYKLVIFMAEDANLIMLTLLAYIQVYLEPPLPSHHTFPCIFVE